MLGGRGTSAGDSNGEVKWDPAVDGMGDGDKLERKEMVGEAGGDPKPDSSLRTASQTQVEIDNLGGLKVVQTLRIHAQSTSEGQRSGSARSPSMGGQTHRFQRKLR
jgi:hypothetical protein